MEAAPEEDTAPSEMPPQPPETGPSAKDQAMIEERNAAERIAQQRASEEHASMPPPPADDEPVVSIAAKGLDYLHQKLREHAAKPKPVYVPPPITEGMAERIREEQETGARAVRKHEAQQAARPQPVRDQREGFTTPVYRPNDVVPDPTQPAPSGFAAGNKKFSADA
jgi:hypothetical protein